MDVVVRERWRIYDNDDDDGDNDGRL